MNVQFCLFRRKAKKITTATIIIIILENYLDMFAVRIAILSVISSSRTIYTAMDTLAYEECLPLNRIFI